MKLKKGDTVLIIAGKNRGKTGTIETIMPQVNRVIVSGANMFKKHVKPSAQNPTGGIIEIARSMHSSNVMVIEPDSKKATRIGYANTGHNKTRVARINGKSL
jgi:large subunit ribosomal protein L24